MGRSLHTKGKEFNTTLNTLPEETFGARWKEICNCCGELNASNKCSCKEKGNICLWNLGTFKLSCIGASVTHKTIYSKHNSVFGMMAFRHQV